MQRLLIYLTYDRQNRVDDYIGYFLGCMRPLAATIAVVCNMPRIEGGLHNLTDHADLIFYRENKGLDAGGFKDALCRWIGWNRVGRYDEVILANDSFYGPFADLGGIFTEMESRGLDFWGLMGRGAGEYGAIGRDPEHILSFFYAFQAPLIHSRAFQEYWETMPYYGSYMEVVKQYERQLTRHFADLGYTYGTYADTAPNETKNLRNQFFQCDYLAYEMITKRRFPFLKRKQLSYNTLYHQTQENLARSIDYVDRHTAYDAEMIWKNLIRTQHPARLQRSLALQYILEERGERECPGAVVCVRAAWENAVDTVWEYLDRVKTACAVRIYAAAAAVAAHYRERGFAVTVSGQSDFEILQEIGEESYTYVCLLHDADLSSDSVPSCTGKSYFFHLWENLASSAGHVVSLVETLEQKRYIGILFPPVPIFGDWLGRLGLGWENRFGEVKGHLEDWHIDAVLDDHTPPVHATNNFWIRTRVIASWTEKIRRASWCGPVPDDLCRFLWDSVVQDAGCLPGIVESSFYAAMNEANQQYYLREILGWFTESYGFHGQLHEFKEIFHVQQAAEVCRTNYRKWYVYGTGETAQRCLPWVQDTSAFVVSDGHGGGGTFHGRPVLSLSELETDEETGVILCLGEEYRDVVAALLEEKGIRHVYKIR